MTQISRSDRYGFPLGKMDYEWMTGAWEGPKGAAYNVVYEDCREAGYVSREGQVTQRGMEAIREYKLSHPDDKPLGV